MPQPFIRSVLRILRTACLAILTLAILPVGCSQPTPTQAPPTRTPEPTARPTEIPEDEKPILLFEIDEGLGGVEVTSAHGKDFDALRTQLANILEGLDPLRARYRLAVLVYPTHHYKAEGYGEREAGDPLDRISPSLHEVLRFFGEEKVAVYLEMHSSGIRTNQNGEAAKLPPAELRFGDGIPCRSLPMDMDTMEALKAAYPDTFEGIRFHELIGSHDIGTADRAAGKEQYSHAWVVEERVVKGIIDAAASCGLDLVWSDHSWNLIYEKPDKVYKPKAFWLDWVDYAIGKLGTDRLTLNWANNGWPVHQYVTDTFLLKGYKGAGYGESVQSWFWQEMDCASLSWVRPGTTSPATKWYLYPELDMPAELMAAFTLRALENGARMVQFEPPQYLFNTNNPRFRPLRDLSNQYETAPDYSARLVLKRLVAYLLDPDNPDNPSTTLSDYFDTDRWKFNRNLETSPAKRYYQATLGVIDAEGARRYFDRYNNDLTRWIEQSENRSLDTLFGPDLVQASRINLTFSCIDEFFVVRRTGDGVVGQFHNNLQGLLVRDTLTFADNEDGTFVCAAPLNLFPEYLPSLDATGDDLVVVRSKPEGGGLTLTVYQCASQGSAEKQAFRYVPVDGTTAGEILDRFLGSESIPGEGFRTLLPVRARNVMLKDGTRPVDAGLLALSTREDALVLAGAVDRKGRVVIAQSLPLDGAEFRAACTADIDGDFVDEVCLVVRKDGHSTIRFLRLSDSQFEWLPETIDLGETDPAWIYSLRTGTYTQVP